MAGGSNTHRHDACSCSTALYVVIVVVVVVVVVVIVVAAPVSDLDLTFNQLIGTVPTEVVAAFGTAASFGGNCLPPFTPLIGDCDAYLLGNAGVLPSQCTLLLSWYPSTKTLSVGNPVDATGDSCDSTCRGFGLQCNPHILTSNSTSLFTVLGVADCADDVAYVQSRVHLLRPFSIQLTCNM